MHGKTHLDLSVREQEHGGLALKPGLAVQRAEILLELQRAVQLGDLDLEHVHLRRVRRQPRQRLAAGATDADQHGVAAGQRQHTVDAHKVPDCVAEQDTDDDFNTVEEFTDDTVEL